MIDDTVILTQISDLHLGPMPPIPWRLLNLKRLTGFLNWHRKRRFMHLPAVAEQIIADVKAQNPDHIAVTGDLANIGLPVEIERAAAWLASIGPPDKVSVIPGNHDIYSRVGGINAGTAALKSWRPYFRSDDEGRRYAHNGDFPFVRVLRRGALGVALIGLNSAVETPPFVATGRLGEKQLSALAHILQETRRDGLVRVVMIHHPPLVMSKHDGEDLSDHRALETILNTHGAELIIHGHKHQLIARCSLIQTPILVVGAPSASIGVRRKVSPRKGDGLGSYSYHTNGDDLAAAHYFEISAGENSTSPGIVLISRGLAEPAGAIVELRRCELSELRR